MPRVTVLGSGDAFGAGGRLFGCYLVETSRTAVLIECGPTVLQALKRAACDPARLDGVLISHLHGDHFGGIPFLFMEYRYQSARSRPLTIHGPPGLRERTDALFAALYRRIAASPSPFAATFTEVRPGEAFEVGDIHVEPVGVSHVPELTCFGYRVTAEERTICFSGDSSWSPALKTAAADVDLFLCECSTYDTPLDIHVSYLELAADAAALGCKRVVLTHLGNEVLARSKTLSLECATDGMTIEL